jgi:hypothetical protein
VAGELQAQSQSRDGAAVLWVTIHTAEGPTDDFPSQPDLDAGSAKDLLAFGLRAGDRSWHACCDDDVLLDNLVSYDRAAWTLRNGNNRSDNLEMCGLASWSRAEWLTHQGMLRNAARWVASRLKARGMPVRRVTVAECAARSVRGYMDHWTYTRATDDGTHTDVGQYFPWDVFGGMVTQAFTGQPITGEEDDMPDPKALWDYGIKSDSGAVMSAADRLLDVETRVGALPKAFYLQMYGDSADDTKDPNTHPANLQELRRLLLVLVANDATLSALVQGLGQMIQGGVDYDRLREIVNTAAERAVSGVGITFTPPAG